MSMPPPNQDAFRELGANPDRGPIVMLNLLRFQGKLDSKEASPGDEKEAAITQDHGAPSGRESYMRYAEEARKHIERRGGRMLWQGRARMTLIGGEEWDVVALVEYPNAKAFLDMLQDKDYQKAGKDRSAGLADTRLIACEALEGF